MFSRLVKTVAPAQILFLGLVFARLDSSVPNVSVSTGVKPVLATVEVAQFLFQVLPSTTAPARTAYKVQTVVKVMHSFIELYELDLNSSM